MLPPQALSFALCIQVLAIISWLWVLREVEDTTRWKLMNCYKKILVSLRKIMIYFWKIFGVLEVVCLFWIVENQKKDLAREEMEDNLKACE